MSTIPVTDALDHDVWVGPHDVHYSNGETFHLESAPMWVHVIGLIDHGEVVVVMGIAGTVRRAVTYDRSAHVEEAEAA